MSANSGSFSKLRVLKSEEVCALEPESVIMRNPFILQNYQWLNICVTPNRNTINEERIYI